MEKKKQRIKEGRKKRDSSAFRQSVGRSLCDIVRPSGSPWKQKSTCLPETLSLTPCSSAKKARWGTRRCRIEKSQHKKCKQTKDKKDKKRAKTNLVKAVFSLPFLPCFRSAYWPVSFCKQCNRQADFQDVLSRHHFGDQTTLDVIPWPYLHGVL